MILGNPTTGGNPAASHPTTADGPARVARVGLTAYPQVVLVALVTATTSLAYLRYFSDRSFLVATIIAATGGALIAGIAAARRWRATVTLVLTVAGFVLVATFVVFRSTLQRGIPTVHTATALWSGLLSGWSRMLSIGLPADATGELLLTPTLITWLTAVLATLAALRTRVVLLPLLPPLLALGAGLLLTAARPVGGLALPAVVLAELLLLTLVRATETDPVAQTGYRSTRAAWGRFALGVPVVLVVVAAGVAGAWQVPVATGDDRFDPRTVVPVKLDIGDNITPLAGLKGQLRDPDRELFKVRFDGDLAGIDRVRTAALDHFDGSLWTSQDRFLLSGSSLPENEHVTNPRRVSMKVTVGDLPAPYLPSVGWPVRVTAPRFGFSADSGILATDAPTLAGLSYDLVAEVGPSEGRDKAAADLSTHPERYTDLPPGLPPEIRAKGAELAGKVAEPHGKLLAIQDYLQNLPYSLEARPGHSYDALRRLFSPNSSDRIGYAEQFAAAFAVLARSQGFPARVAVGYLLSKPEGDTYTITSGAAHAWAEVNLAGFGWVSFEPTDPQRRAGTVEKPKEQETGQEKDQLDEQIKASDPVEDSNLPKLLANEPTLLDWALWVLIGLGVLIALTPVSVATEKLRRRRRRRSGSRANRIVGAWQETTDRLVEHGVTVSAALTAHEVADRARLRLGDGAGAVALLAPLVNTALFSPVEPDDDAVREAWQLDGRLGQDLRRSRGLWVTVRGWLDPRPLFARRRDARRRRRALDRLTRG